MDDEEKGLDIDEDPEDMDDKEGGGEGKMSAEGGGERGPSDGDLQGVEEESPQEGGGEREPSPETRPPTPEPRAPTPAPVGNTVPVWQGPGRRSEGERGREGGRFAGDRERRVDRPREPVDRELVIPGDLLETGRAKAGYGTYRDGDSVYAACLGIKSSRDGFISVIPLSGKYIPSRGDFVVGKVIEMTPSAWVIDLNSPYVAPLPGSETPWDVQFGEAPKYMSIGDTVLVEIRDVDEMKKVSVTMNGPNLRKLVGGQTIDVDATKVPRIIGRGGSMIGLLKRLTRCHIIVGQNGRIWLDGSVEDVHVALAAIRKIEADAHKLGLTDAVAGFIQELRGGLDRERENRERSADAREKEAILWDRVERLEQPKSQEEE